jgi:hypothetical protein
MAWLPADLSVSGLAPDGCLCDAAADDRGDQLLLYRVFLLVLLRNKQAALMGRAGQHTAVAITQHAGRLAGPFLLGWT